MFARHEHVHAGDEKAKAQMERNIALLTAIQKKGGFGPYTVEYHQEVHAGFSEPENASLNCSDERVTKSGFNLPGSVILKLGGDDRALAARLKRAGITTITSHDGCGAAKLAAVKGSTQEAADAWAQGKIANFCRTYGFQHHHISAKQMSSEGHVHPAPVIYVNYTGKIFNPVRAGMPQGFVVDASIASEGDTVKFVGALRDIAFKPGNAGDTLRHGTGVKFTIVIISPDTEILKMALKPWGSMKNSSTAIDGFALPA